MRSLLTILRCAGTSYLLAGLLTRGAAQQASSSTSMGTVPTRDALVTGGLEVRGERARLLTNASVTAYDHTAAIALDRGGEVLVCSTSQFHLLHAGTGTALLFGLDRGAAEVHSPAATQDVLLTPDIRFAVESPGRFDLKLRVTTNGDTCVDNAGGAAPVLLLSDAFSAASYRLLPGQHVLFEHGSLREVVDRETASCGCPVPTPAPTQVAVAPGQPTPPVVAAAAHPFPEAASNGLAPAAAVAPTGNSPRGEKNTQIATTFNYGEGQGPPPRTVDPPPVVAVAAAKAGTAEGQGAGPAAPPPTPPGAHDIGHAIGRFFRRLLHFGQ